MNIVYGVCLLRLRVRMPCARCRSRSLNWRRGYSVLERPECADEIAHERPAEGGSGQPLLKMHDSGAPRLFLAMMTTGVPVAIAMAGASLVYILLSGDLPPFVVVHRMVSGIDSFPLLAVPFFILAGNLMNNAGITNRIYNFALALVGWLKGGLGHVNIIGSVIFAGMSRHGDRRRRGARHDRDQGDARPRLPTRVLGRRHCRVGDARADHPAVAAVRDLRDDGQRIGRRSCSSPASCPAS